MKKDATGGTEFTGGMEQSSEISKNLYGAHKEVKQKQIVPKKPLVYIDVDISDNETDRIIVFMGDDPKKLAKDFCKKHNLSDIETQNMLEQQLLGKIEKINLEKKAVD